MNRFAPSLAAVVLVFAVAATAGAAGSPCTIGGPGWSWCAGYVTFSSYALSVPFKPFQASAGSGSQADITVNFSPYARQVFVWINDPDYSGNRARFWQIGCCWFNAYFPGDGLPGYFTVDFAGLGPGTKAGFSQLRLESASNDYVNWRVEYRKEGTESYWCRVTAQSSWCQGVTTTVSPFYQGSSFDPFQAVAGTGVQPPIDVTFGWAVNSVAVTAVDPDYFGTRMEAYSASDVLVGTVYFDGDNLPGYTTTSTKSITAAAGIKRIRLISASGDYVAFQGITATPF